MSPLADPASTIHPVAGPPRFGCSHVIVNSPSCMNAWTLDGASGGENPVEVIVSVNSFEGGLEPAALTARTRR